MKNREINILFLGGSKKLSLAQYFIASGKRRGVKINIYSYELNSLEPICSLGKIILGLRWDDQNIEKHLTEVITDNAINIVIPFVDKAALLCAHLKNNLKKVFFPVSDVEISKIMFDKIKANVWYREHGYQVPSNALKLPLIAKLKNGSGGKGSFIIKTKVELDFFRNNFDQTKYLIQSYIDAIEYTVDCYVDKNKKIISIVPRRRLEVINGEVSRSITEKNKDIIALTREIVIKAKLRGHLTIQFLKEKDTDRLFIMEINARIGSGIITSIAAGADVTEYVLNDFLEVKNVFNANWKQDVIMTRAFQEVYFHHNKLLKVLL